MLELQQRQREAKPLPKPELRPSDAVNLADPCSPCEGSGSTSLGAICGFCAGTGKAHDTDRDTLSHTKLGVMLACQRKYHLHYEERLERIDRTEALEMGKAFQKAIEVGAIEAAYGEIMERAHEAVDKADYERYEVNATIVSAAAKLYLSRWEPDDVREMEYRVRLRNPWTGHYSNTYDLHGYADGVSKLHGAAIFNPIEASEGESGWSSHPVALRLTENKLKGSISAVDVKRLPLDRQVTLACYGLWRATGLKVTEVEYRMLKKPSIKRKKGESHREFLSRIEADYEERPDFYLYEQTLFRTDADLLRVECELWQWSRQLRDMRRQQLYPRNTDRCGDWGGCQFSPICSGDPDAMSLYRVRDKR
jgi:hypothetical protein